MRLSRENSSRPGLLRSFAFPFLLSLGLLMGFSGADAAEVTKIVVEAPVVYNAPDVERLAPGLRSVLASRLSRPGISVVNDPEPGSPSWVVRTTIVRLGSFYSVDAALEPPPSPEREKTRRAYEKASSVDGLLPALESVAKHLMDDFEAPPEPRSAARAPSARQPSGTAPAVSAPAPAPAIPGRMDHLLQTPRIGPSVKGEAKSLAVADLDRDGLPEILVVANGEISVFKDRGGKIEPVGKPLRPRRFDPYVISAGDANGDGAPEVFVAGLSGTYPQTQVYRWTSGGLVEDGSLIDAALKVFAHPDKGTIVLGMLPGNGGPVFAPGMRRFVPKGGTYETAEIFQAPDAAEAINVDWLRLVDGAPAATLITSNSEHLRLHDGSGKLLFESADRVKGSRNLWIGAERQVGYMDADVRRAQARSVLWPAPDGYRYILLPVNHSSTSRALPRSPAFSHGQLVAFRWDGLALITGGEGPKVPGFFADIDVWSEGKTAESGRMTVYGVLVQSQGLLLQTVESKVLAYDL